ncbi:NUDIX hydrolase [Humibacter albus]|uniref:NUDIX hydrolase n=1 Tax=Humibacter albus TaxID=427754 RepID=UPI0003B3AAB6|nr:CoA pyrophosphatase [Humibacter albus]
MTEPPSAATPASPPRSTRELLAGLANVVDPAALERLPVGVDARPASVLVLFSEDAGRAEATSPTPSASPITAPAELDVLLQVRASTLRQHAGQVSFPGGRAEPGDTDAVQTALREAAEETGLDPTGVDVLATLPALPLAASNHRVTPVLAWWANPIPLRAIDPAETTRVWQAPVSRMLDPASRFTFVVERFGSRFRGPAFDIDGTIVWGFTAIVLDRIFDAAGWAVPWDASRERAVES